MNEIEQLKEKVRNLKVLFVDDEEDIREATGTFLRKFFDNVVICSNGEEGLEIYSKTKDFDIVITDMMMPKMNGAVMARKIKDIDKNMFIVFITALRNIELYEDGLCNISLQKPISFEDIILIMKELGN
ncbi:response regulator [Sulfurimonas sp.]